MTQTTNFQLNQWSENDYVRRTDFNADNAKIEAALTALPQLVFGTYTGDGAASRTIELGFTPKALIVTDSRGGFFRFSSNLGRIFGGIVFPGKPAQVEDRMIMAICDNGFQVYKDTITPYASTNYSGEEYRYIAIK